MSAHREDISAERLFEASEGVLAAVAELSARNQGPVPWPAGLMGSPQQPDALTEFTRFEVEQASLFLVRMGYLSIGKAGAKS